MPDKLVLGLAAYGRNWPVGETRRSARPIGLQGRTTVTARSVDDLLALRGGHAGPCPTPASGRSNTNSR